MFIFPVMSNNIPIPLLCMVNLYLILVLVCVGVVMPSSKMVLSRVVDLANFPLGNCIELGQYLSVFST